MRRLAIAIGLILATIFVVRAWDAWRAPPLKLWHTEVPHDLDADDISAADWNHWLAAEDKVFAEVRARVTDKLPAWAAARSSPSGAVASTVSPQVRP